MSENLFAPTVREGNQLSAAGNSHAVAQAKEVEARVIMAKRFPRDEFEAFERIRKACQRKELAEKAQYVYPRGGTKVEGPSIRLAEALAQCWGNIDTGITELDQNTKESTLMAYAWDLETNTRITKTFTVPHVRYTKAAGNINLVDPRDIYEMTANQGARRQRACILAVIPGDVVDSAVEMCKETLKKNLGGPIEDVVKKLLASFKDKYGTTKEMIEEYIGYNAESFTEQDVIKLRGVYASLKDGMAKKEDYFNYNANKTGKGAGKTKGKNILEENEPLPAKDETPASEAEQTELGDDIPDIFKEQVNE